MSNSYSLVADIGGTNIRLAAFSHDAISACRDLMAGDLQTEARYRWDEVENFNDALAQFQTAFGLPKRFKTVAVAHAGLVSPGQEVFGLTNRSQSYTLAQLSSIGDQVHVINDFAAQASLIPHLAQNQISMIKPGTPYSGARAVLGPGTGLGVAGLDVTGRVIPGEGGHVSLPALSNAPTTQMRALLGRAHIRLEDVLSGSGIENLHQALGHEYQTAQQLSQAALAGEAAPRETFDVFFDYLALACGNQALQYLTTGGVYLVGNISLQNMTLMNRSRFAEVFETIISHQDFLRRVPVYLVLTETSGLAGAAAYLSRARVS